MSHSYLTSARRIRTAGLHLIASLTVAACAAALIFFLWYPTPYGHMAGGVSLFLLLVGVDVSLGPLLTAICASPQKSVRDLRRDLAVIVLLQACGLGYGIYAVSQGRPVHLALEGDRFRVISAADVDHAVLQEAPLPLRRLPWMGPTLIASTKPVDQADQLKSIELAIAGFDLSLVPRNWRSYDSQVGSAWNAARPLAMLVSKHPEAVEPVNALTRTSGYAVGELRFLPIICRAGDWVAVITQQNAAIVGYLNVDGFF